MKGMNSLIVNLLETSKLANSHRSVLFQHMEQKQDFPTPHPEFPHPLLSGQTNQEYTNMSSEVSSVVSTSKQTEAQIQLPTE